MEAGTKTLIPPESTNRRTVAEIYSALATGNMETVLERLAPDIKWTVVPGDQTAGTYYGPELVLREALAPLAAVWADFEMTPFEFTAVGDKVFVVGESRGVHRASGKVGTARFVHVWHLRDGIAYRFESVSDTHAMRRATQ
ncbi:nuclear transport factor 2 family protein [Nonomuraea polychroma]|uniref:nuclear transport factor 2 family protein n=1 Tax=Nonomuraea polychroma TaxID=46176 RepID=UPI003D8EE4ED